MKKHCYRQAFSSDFRKLKTAAWIYDRDIFQRDRKYKILHRNIP